MSVRLYVGNLPKEVIERQTLQEMFSEAGDEITTKLIKDRKTGKCRGFAFVTVPSDEIADRFIEKFNGQSFMDSSLKIEKALPRAKGKGKEQTNGEQPQAQSNANPSSSSKKQKHKRSQSKNTAAVSHSESIRPDPRWASELAKLKEMLSAQTTNS